MARLWRLVRADVAPAMYLGTTGFDHVR